ncbi:hypothetical protein WOLCODRAFT_136812 [Wolfiporia cocos MD-104 SS10]|uniref:Uncharacterized protein n=1 Tax=Wolfiporia cocos (strain MD-104) TaxID=742152 RepID=A0A2H3JW15_WOLCO|nr:hypothetical protein WOLCODRAFT_136812 [Wolfiporia cocos MD-104 SS10]
MRELVKTNGVAIWSVLLPNRFRPAEKVLNTGGRKLDFSVDSTEDESKKSKISSLFTYAHAGRQGLLRARGKLKRTTRSREAVTLLCTGCNRGRQRISPRRCRTIAGVWRRPQE